MDFHSLYPYKGCPEKTKTSLHKRKNILLPLAVLSQISITSSDTVVRECIIKRAPKLLQADLLFLSEIVGKCHRKELPFYELWYDLLITGFKTSSNFRDPLRIIEFVKDYMLYIDFNWVISHVFNLLELDEAIILFCICNVDNYITLNNVLMLCAFYGKHRMVIECLEQGADDLKLAQRAAAVTGNSYLMSFIGTLNKDSERFDRFKETELYYYYHHASRNHVSTCLNNMFTQTATLERHLNKGMTARSCVMDNVECLLYPTCFWSDKNLFKLLHCIPCNILQQIGSVCRLRIRFLFCKLVSDTDDDGPNESQSDDGY